MNERIKELAEQNGFIHNWQTPGEQYDKLQALEKFAELIVRESAVELRRLALKQWVWLTDEEIQDLAYLSQKIDEGNAEWFDRWGFAKAIEQALKEKNT